MEGEWMGLEDKIEKNMEENVGREESKLRGRDTRE